MFINKHKYYLKKSRNNIAPVIHTSLLTFLFQIWTFLFQIWIKYSFFVWDSTKNPLSLSLVIDRKQTREREKNESYPPFFHCNKHDIKFSSSSLFTKHFMLKIYLKIIQRKSKV